jgi:GNAT superfamily N-acetyltransferase
MRYDFRAAVEAPNEPRELFEARMALWLEGHLGRGWKAWLACEGDATVGHVFLHVIGKVPNPVPEPEQLGYVTNLYVRPDCRGRGVGAGLLDVALEECRALGLDTVVLWPSPRSKSLYERRGFVSPADVLELPLGDHSSRQEPSPRPDGPG